MRCPRCSRLFNILQFKRLEIPTEFEDNLTPVYKCPKGERNSDGEHGCGFLFAPAESAIEEWLRRKSDVEEWIRTRESDRGD